MENNNQTMILGTEYFFCEMAPERPAVYGYQMEIHCKYKQFVIITKKINEKVLKYFILYAYSHNLLRRDKHS